MKIDSNFIERIFNLEIKLVKKEDKIKLSTYENQIPMFDIYSQKIYPINKLNIHHRLIESHYRFINEEVVQRLKNLYQKYINDQILGPKFKYNLDVIDNYEITTLVETSYKTLYKYSPNLGLLVSICERNSFHPFIQHLKPYYSKLELIKLGQNMNLVDLNLEPEYLIDHEIHYNVCKTVSKNDVSFDEIKSHHQYIYDNNLISWICFYSFTGSFLFNKYLRYGNNKTNQINSIFLKGLIQIVKKMENSPELLNDYDIYRFIWDDSFLLNLKEGDIFEDKGFLSTTRDPFYSPGLNGNFGLILLKIKIPKNKKGVGLFIENFSLFPKEEEFLLPPNSRLKLKSSNSNFKYYHTNPEFEKLINRKYEFELVDIQYNKFFMVNKYYEPKFKEKFFPINQIQINGIDRVDLIKKFILNYSNFGKVNLKINNSFYSFVYQWFDSTDTSSYSKFYWNKVKDGILFSLFDDDGYPYLNIEMGPELVINFVNSIYYGTNKTKEITEEMLEIIYNFGRLFYYKNAIIFHKFSNFDEYSPNYNLTTKIFLSMNMYNHSVYSYFKNGTKYLDFNPFISYNIGYWYLDEFMNKKIDAGLLEKLPNELKKSTNNKELLIKTVEKHFYFYPKLIQQIDKNIVKNSYVIFNVYDKLVAEGLAETFKPNIEHTNENVLDDNFKLVFRQPIRRL
jgi:hypothetical protein